MPFRCRQIALSRSNQTLRIVQRSAGWDRADAKRNRRELRERCDSVIAPRVPDLCPDQQLQRSGAIDQVLYGKAAQEALGQLDGRVHAALVQRELGFYQSRQRMSFGFV